MSRETTRTAQKGDRTAGTARVSAPSRVKAARVARDHGKNRNADGSLHSTPSTHKATDGAK